jgi:hypothetical protein
MKWNKFFVAMMLTGGIIFTSCDEMLDINESPNNPATSTPALTLPAAQVNLATHLESTYNLHGSFLAHYWTQGPTASQYRFIEEYNITTTVYGPSWAALYAGVLTDLQFVKTSATTSGLTNYAAIAQLMQAYTFQLLVDMYDKVPYEDALKGKQSVMQPRFDDGDIIYDDLILKIDEALGWISSNSATPGDDDLIYGGDMTLWRKFGNTLKLKIYIRQALSRPSVSQAGIQSLYASNAQFLDVEEDARVTFTNATGSENPLWQELDRTAFGNIVASKTSIDVLLGNADPRLTNLYDGAVNGGQFIGLAQGRGTADGGQFADYSVPDGDRIINQTSPAYFMTAYESLFLQAEAVQRGWGTGNAKDLYDAAVIESFDFWGVNGTGFVAPGGAYEYDGQLETIYFQKWLAFNGKQGFEGWTEWRRTGVPALQRSEQGAPLPNVFPLRLIWPSNETSSNQNAPAFVSVDTPVWWDETF